MKHEAWRARTERRIAELNRAIKSQEVGVDWSKAFHWDYYWDGDVLVCYTVVGYFAGQVLDLMHERNELVLQLHGL